MYRIFTFVAVSILAFSITTAVAGQQVQPVTSPQAQAVVTEAAGDIFHSQVISQAIKLNQEGKLQRRDLLKLRVAMLSPAFRQRAQELAVIQIASSGQESDKVPLNEDGTVNVASIDWQGLTDFISALVPLLLQLLEAISKFS